MFNVEREAVEVSQDVVGVFNKTRNCEPKIERLSEAREDARAQVEEACARINDVFDNMSVADAVADAVADEDGELLSRIKDLQDKMREANEFSAEAQRHTDRAEDRFHSAGQALREAASIAGDIHDIIN